MNFFLILPVLNASFVTLMPFAATLTSKLLFGFAMAAVLRPTPQRCSVHRDCLKLHDHHVGLTN
jgi:hypothetical protein